MKERVVITGATGFVGSNLTRFLLEKGFEVNVIVRVNSDLTNISSLKNDLTIFKYDNNIQNLVSFFKNVRPVCTFHLASNFIAEHTVSQIDGLVESNIKFGLHLLEAMKEVGIKNFINTGTSWQHYKNEGYNPVCLYAATKQAFEALIEYYFQAENFKVVTLKLFDTYGQNDTRPKLINMLGKYSDESFELKMSPGNQKVNLVHIQDVCNAFFVSFKHIVTSNESFNKIYMVKNKFEYKLKDVVRIFEEVNKKKLIIDWGGRPYRKREVMELWDRGEILPNWEPQISLREGLKI